MVWWLGAAAGLAFTVLFCASLVHHVAVRGGRRMSDFAPVWSAAVLAAQGNPGAAYDAEAVVALERRHIWPEIPVCFPWVYPPNVLLLVEPLGRLPYHQALVAWLVSHFALLALVLARIGLPLGGAAAVAGSPGVVANVSFGQNGMLTAGLVGTGLAWLARRPFLAGACFALAAYKPHLALPIPVALLAGGHRRALAGMAVTVTGWLVATWLRYPSEVWERFREATLDHVRWLGSGDVPSSLVVSCYGALRSAGLGTGASMAIQLGASLAGLAALVWCWRRAPGPDLAGSALVLAMVTVSPKVVSYDLVVLLLPIAWLVARSDHDPRREPLLAAAWVLPLAGPALAARTGFQPAPLVILALWWLVLARVAAGSRARPSPVAGSR